MVVGCISYEAAGLGFALLLLKKKMFDVWQEINYMKFLKLLSIWISSLKHAVIYNGVFRLLSFIFKNLLQNQNCERKPAKKMKLY